MRTLFLALATSATIFATGAAAAISASAKQGETPKMTVGGQAVRGDLVLGLEADLKNNSLRRHIPGAEKRVESNDGLGQKLAQARLPPRQTQAQPLWNRLEQYSLQTLKRSPSLGVPELSGARPQGPRQPQSHPF
jgi:hypothetical protein